MSMKVLLQIILDMMMMRIRYFKKFVCIITVVLFVQLYIEYKFNSHQYLEKNTLKKKHLIATEITIVNNLPTTVTNKLEPQLKFNTGLLVEWFAICIQDTVANQLWHPLFPKHITKTTVTLDASDDDRHTGQHLRRIYGFLHTEETGFYDFRLLSRDGADELFGGYPWRYYKVFDSISQKDFFNQYYDFWQRLVPDDKKEE